MRGVREQIARPIGHSFRLLRWDKSPEAVETIITSSESSHDIGMGACWHYHTEYELTLFTKGKGTRFVGDNISHFTDGDLVFLGECLPHYWLTRDKSAGVAIQFSFPSGHPFWQFPETLPMNELFKKAAHGIVIHGQTREKITKLMSSTPRYHGASQLGLLFIILEQLNQAPESELQSLSHQAFHLSEDSSYKEKMAEAVRYMTANYREPISLDEILEFTEMSRATFSRHFKRHSGRSFTDFLNKLRLQAACRDLQDSQHKIIDVAYRNGFSHISFFNQLFKREFDCTPSEYRENSVKDSS